MQPLESNAAMIQRLALFLFLAAQACAAAAFELLVEPVSEHAYALAGDIGPRSAENHALNNTLGFLVTGQGVALIGSGASPGGARLIQQQVATVTEQPIRWVINIGAQDHHWLGNDYFARQGAEILALASTVATQKAHAKNHLKRLQEVLGAEAAAAVTPHYAPQPIPQDAAVLHLGELELRLMRPGNGHFPGDAVLWFEAEKAAFTGDFVFHDRMLGIHPFTPIVQWRNSFNAIAALQPEHVIPGHGRPGDLAQARRDTGDYLHWLVESVGAAIEDWTDLADTIDQLAEAPRFQHLQFYEQWHARNIHQTYLQLESAR